MKSAGLNSLNIDNTLFNGGYPRLFNENIEPARFFPNYIETCLQRDVRLLKNIENTTSFVRFIKLCAGRVGQILDLSSLARDANVAVNTVKLWLSVLEASYILYFVQPFSGNVNRRMIKSPKLYFYYTGLICSLLNIENEKQLNPFYLRGNLFENFVFSELTKMRCNVGLSANYYFLRDSKGVEIDCVQELFDAVCNEHTGNTEQLYPLRKELKLIDTQVEAFVGDYGFLRTYFSARRVHDLRNGGGKKADNCGDEK